MNSQTHRLADSQTCSLVVSLSLLLLLLCLPAAAQQPWGYTSIDEACLDETYIVAPPSDVQALLPAMPYNTSYRISGPYGGHRYRLQNDSVDISLRLPAVNSLLPYMVSHRYWQRRYRQLVEWTYIDMRHLSHLVEVDTADRRNYHYSPLTWLGYSFQPSEQYPVVYTVLTNTHTPQQLTLPALERLAEWGSFASDRTVQAYRDRQQAYADSLAARTRRQQLTLDSLDLHAARAATTADSLRLVLYQDSIDYLQAQAAADVQRTKQLMNSRSLFLFSIKPAHSDHMFGLQFNFYNCFDRTIAKIEITIAPYDSRNRLQTDTFGRRVRDVRCMGPITPGAPAQYTFDELFWDDAGRIRYLRVTAITFYFTDGTSRTFRGYDTILKHCLRG